jgi:alcohol dehydrogenase class IV
LAILCATGGFIADYEFGHKCISRALPVVAVPTTCGSGSEVTPYAVINNSDTGRKFTLSHPCLLPQKALIDPVLLKNLPVAVFRSGVLDALIHSLEARLSCVQNVLIHPFAEASIATLLKHFPVQGKPSSEQALHDYALASLYGGLSIAHARTGLIHTLSVAFARYVPLSHGLLNALMAPYVFNFNRGHYAGVCASLLARIWPDRVWSDETACDFLIHWFQERTADLSLADFDLSGVSVAALTDRVEQDKGLPLVNWRQYSRAELSSLIGEIISDAIR